MKFIYIQSLIFFIFLGVQVEAQSSSYSCPLDRPDLFCRSVEQYPNSQINEKDFYFIPVKIYSLFQLELNLLSSPLAFDLNWKSPYFGAGVSHYQNQFKLMILGGTTRIESLTPEAYAALVCHEIGHLIGGHPLQTISGASWASAEGQADFFAASVCLPKYFKSLGVKDQEISAQVESAGFHLIETFLSVETNPDEFPVRFQKVAKKVNETLINRYPTLACRYETFLDYQKRQDCWFKEF